MPQIHMYCKFVHLGTRLTSAVTTKATFVIVSQVGKTIHCCLCAFIAVIIGEADQELVCFADKLQPMVCAFLVSLSHTKWLNITEELANK